MDTATHENEDHHATRASLPCGQAVQHEGLPMNETTKDQEAAAQAFITGMQKFSGVFQQSSAQVQALEILALCLFTMHPNPEGVRRMFAEASKLARIASERATLPEASAFHEAFCKHLDRLTTAMPERTAAPGIH